MTDESFHLTPLDIRRYDFGAKSFRGYDEKKVEDFRNQVAEELERLTRLNQELDSKARGFHEQLRAFRERDKALNEALVSAQQLRSEIREQAEREAQLDPARGACGGRAPARRHPQRHPPARSRHRGAREVAPRLHRAAASDRAAAARRARCGGRRLARTARASFSGAEGQRRCRRGQPRAHEDPRLAGVARQGMTPYRFDDPLPHVAVPPQLAHTRAQAAHAAQVVRDRFDRVPDVAIILGTGLGALGRAIETQASDRLRGHPRFSAVDRRVARRSPAVRHARRQDRRRDAGALPSCTRATRRSRSRFPCA